MPEEYTREELLAEKARREALIGDTAPRDVLSEFENAKTANERYRLRGEIIKTGEAVPIGTRLSARWKATKTGTFNLLKDKYGEKDEQGRPIVVSIGDDNYAVRRPGKPPLVLEDVGSAIAEFGKDALDEIPNLLKGVGAALGAVGGAVIGAPAGPLGVAAGGLGGGAVAAGAMQGAHQAGSATLPGADYSPVFGEPSPEPRAGPVFHPNWARGVKARVGAAADEAAMDVLGAAAGRGVMKGLKFVNPLTAGKRAVSKLGSYLGGSPTPTPGGGIVPAREAAKIGHALTEGTGVTLTPGGASLNDPLLAIQRTIAQTAGGGPTMRAAETRELLASAKFANKAIEQALGPDRGATMASDTVAKAYSGHIQKIWGFMLKDGTEKFGRAEALRSPPISTPKTVQVINEIIRKESIPFPTDPASRLVEFLAKRRKKFQGTLTLEKMQSMLSTWGKAAYGVELALPKKIGRARNDRVAKKIFNALRDDLSAAADTPEGAGAVALKEARDSYARWFQILDDAQNSTLNKFLKEVDPKNQLNSEGFDARDLKAVHRLARDLVGDKFNDDQVREILTGITGIDSEAGQMLRRAGFEELLGTGRMKVAPAVASAGGAIELPFSAAKFANVILSNIKRTKTIVGDREAFDIIRAARIMQRQAQTAGMAGSQTFRGNDWLQVLKIPVQLFTSPGQAAETVAVLFTRKHLAEVFTDPVLSREFLQLVVPRPGMGPEHVGRVLVRLLEYFKSKGETESTADPAPGTGPAIDTAPPMPNYGEMTR